MLQAKVKSGLKWNVINQVVTQLIFVWFGIYLARLLGPEAYGLVGMITVFSGFANLFVDFGFGSAIIYDQNLTNKKTSSVFWFNLAIGLFIYLIFYSLSPLLAEFYKEPKLINLTRVVTLSLLINSLAGIPNTLLSKNIDFKLKIVVAWVATFLSYGVAFWMAYNNWGVWSLVFQGIIFSVINLMFVWKIAKWRPMFYFSWNEISGLFSYGSGIVGTNMLGYLTRNLDNLLIGKFIGNASLGIYTRSYSLMMLPISNVTSVFGKVLFPAFSIIQDDKDKIAFHYLKVIKFIALVTFPLMVGLFTVAEEFVLLVLGVKWIEAIPIIKMLSILGAAQSVLSLNGVIYNATGNAGKAFRVTLYLNVVLIPSWILGLYLGELDGLVLAYLLVGTIGAIPILHEAIKIINLKLIDVWKQLYAIFLGCIFIILVGFLVNTFNLTLEVSLLFKIILSIPVYASIIFFFDKNILNDLIKVIKPKKEKKSTNNIKL
ncbi:PST family polysaccharide transporter [Pontibacter aydingkolensis]|uniref:Lipopolysaccharide biosynthesis protein n=1 Tax=Pontibacter aydingkolensis TaxID=1911536 RepID=A0ABS7CV51_9BACT|nr:lipopolysaccharide biosynthesis protein [Pontibacter aydingkolensis]MBW7467675.1 lipopolysaccharide biosynthesis protein [Pontibacter aydingkolensis]